MDHIHIVLHSLHLTHGDSSLLSYWGQFDMWTRWVDSAISRPSLKPKQIVYNPDYIISIWNLQQINQILQQSQILSIISLCNYFALIILCFLIGFIKWQSPLVLNFISDCKFSKKSNYTFKVVLPAILDDNSLNKTFLFAEVSSKWNQQKQQVF